MVNLQRVLVIIERDMRKFFRSPTLMMSSMIFPLLQLVFLGYAFGGKIRGVAIALVDHDRSTESLRVREAINAIETGPRTFHVLNYDSSSDAVTDLRTGFIRGVIEIPPDYSQRVHKGNRPQIAFIQDNTDQFMSNSLLERIRQMVDQLNSPAVPAALPGKIELQVVEVYPYIEYIKYLLAGSIAMAIFIVAMIGGGITFIDDKARGLHEGYLVTPIRKSELVLGLVGSGAMKGIMAGMVLSVIGGLIAGIPRLWDPVRLTYILIVVAAASVTMISFMFLVMVRVDDPLVPRAIFGVLNTLLFFPSGAVYPIEGFPAWLRWISVVDPFRYTVHALRNLTLKSTGIAGIYQDVLILMLFSAVLIASSIALFRRQI